MSSSTGIAVPADSADVPAAPDRVRASWRGGLILSVVVALVAVLPVLAHPASRFIGASGDAQVFAWYLAWWPHAIGSGIDPFLSHVVNAPDGANLMWNASMPFAALILTPLQLIAGPVAAYNALIALLVAANTAGAFMLTRRIATTTSGAHLGAIAFAASPFVVGHAQSHPNLALCAFLPVLGALLLDLVRGDRSPRRTGLLLGGVLSVQMLLGTEIVVIGALACGIVALWALLRHRSAALALGRSVLTVGLIAVPLMLVVLVVPLWETFFGSQRPSNAYHPAGVFDLDAANLLVSTTLNVPSLLSMSGADGWSGNFLETTGFVFPFVALALLVRRRWSGSPIAGAAWALIGAGLILALGPELQFAGTSTGMPLPAKLLEHLPVINHLLPVRLTVLMFLGLAVLLALGTPAGPPLSWVPAGSPARRLGIGLFTTLTILAAFPAWPMHTFAVPRLDSSMVRDGELVAFAPHPAIGGDPMLWQAQDDFRWNQFDSYVLTPRHALLLQGGKGSRFPCLTAGKKALVPCQDSMRQDLAGYGIDVLVAGPGPSQASYIAELTRVMGKPDRAGSTAFWRLSP